MDYMGGTCEMIQLQMTWMHFLGMRLLSADSRVVNIRPYDND